MTPNEHRPAPGTHLYDVLTGEPVMEITAPVLSILPEDYWLGNPFCIAVPGKGDVTVHRFPRPAAPASLYASVRAPRRRPLSEVFAEGQIPLEWVVEDLLPMGAVTLFAGGPKVGKTTAFLTWLRAMHLAEPEWCGLGVTPSVCWLYTDEGSRTLARAIEKTGIPAGPGEPIQHQITLASDNYLSWEELCAHIGDEVRALQTQEREAREQGWEVAEVPPRCIIIDTMGAWAGPDDVKDYSRMTRLLLPVKRLRDRTGCAIGLVHHTSKPRGDAAAAIDAVLGSQALNGQTDHIVLMTRHSDVPDGRHLYIETRVGYESGIWRDVVLGPEGYRRMTPEDEAAAEREKAQAREQEREAVLGCFSTDWLKRRDAMKKKPSTINEARFKDHVNALLETGRLEDNGEALNSPKRMYRFPGGVVPLA